MSVQWADPPPIGGPQDPRAVYMERLRLVKEQPGRWALIRSGTPSAMHLAATALRKRQYNIPPGLWEFTVRTFRRGVHVGDMHVANLYARFMGQPDDWVERWQRSTSMRFSPTKAEFNDEGERVCPDCRGPLEWGGVGSVPWRCDACWERIDPKWLRRRERLRRQRAEREAAS